MKMNRRQFLGRTTGALAATSSSYRAFAQNTTKMRVGTIPIVDSAPLFVGIEKGFFGNLGLDIDTTPAPGGAALLPALAAGQFQAAFSNTTSTLLAMGEGLPFRFVTAGCSTGPKGPDLAGLMVRVDAPIRTGRDLEGKRVAVNNRNNIMWIRTAAWIDKTGGQASRATFVEIPFPQMVDALVGGRVDAAMVNEPFLSVGLQAQKTRQGAQLAAFGYGAERRRIAIRREQRLVGEESGTRRAIRPRTRERRCLGAPERTQRRVGKNNFRLYPASSGTAAWYRSSGVRLGDRSTKFAK